MIIENKKEGITDQLIVDPTDKKYVYVTKYDAAIAMTEAEFERVNSVNGFSKKRLQRVIGEIPIAEYFEMERQAKEHGEQVTTGRLKRFLEENPEYRTVTAIDTGRDPRIIIK